MYRYPLIHTPIIFQVTHGSIHDNIHSLMNSTSTVSPIGRILRQSRRITIHRKYPLLLVVLSEAQCQSLFSALRIKSTTVMTAFQTVYMLLYADTNTTNVLGIFADLQDANHECIRYAAEADIDLTSDSSTTGPDQEHFLPLEPLRWDSAEGISCWIEEHTVTPKKTSTPPRSTAATNY